MKRLSFCLAIVSLLAIGAPDAYALTCAAGVYRAGCVGAHGAVVTRRPVAVVHPHCYMRAGVRVCR